MEIKPILFNTEMVQAILDGKKTQTRRVAFPHDDLCEFRSAKYPEGWWYKGSVFRSFNAFRTGRQSPRCKYRSGDVVWVRETWYKDTNRYMYRASYGTNERFYSGGKEVQIRWKPSTHMPKDAARIFLRVTNVRLEHLQGCAKGWGLDIEKEGVKTPQDPILYLTDDDYHAALREAMEKNWNSTIKGVDMPVYGWDANPWVWVIEFERCEKPEGWNVNDENP